MLILTFNKEEAWMRSKIPVKTFEELKNVDTDELRIIDFSGNGYCTDAVLKVIASKIKKTLTNLIEVNLQGCILVTDYGIKWLCEIIKGADKLCQIYLDGCVKLTDTSLIMIDKVTPPLCRIMMRGTSLTHLDDLPTKFLNSSGCPFLRHSEDEVTDNKCGYIPILPQNGVKHSMSHYMKTKAIIPSKRIDYETNLMIEEWNMSVLEMPLESPLFDLTVSKPVQVIIPVDTSSTVEEMKEHVINTLTRVASTETYFPRYENNPVQCDEWNGSDFIDSYVTTNCTLAEDGVLSCYCKDNNKRANFISARRLTRSQNYVELTVLEVCNPSEKDKLVFGLVSSPVFASFFHSGDWKVLTADTNKECKTAFIVDLVEGKTIRIGVTGDWISEYCLGPGSYNLTVDGEKIIDVNIDKAKVVVFQNGWRRCNYQWTYGDSFLENVDSHVYLNIMMFKNGKFKHTQKDYLSKKTFPVEEDVYKLHPFISVVGEAKIKIKNICIPPEETMMNLKNENKWITAYRTQNTLIDRHGTICFMPSSTSFGSFVSMSPFSPNNKECTIKMKNIGKTGEIYIGIGQQDQKLSNDMSFTVEDTMFYECRTGKIYKGKENVTENEKGSFEDKDELKVKVDFEGIGQMTCTIHFYRNGDLVAKCPKTIMNSEGVSLMYLLIAFQSSNYAEIQLNNYHSQNWRPANQSRITLGEACCVNIYDDGLLESNCCCRGPTAGELGVFISKVPFNSELLYFEMKVVSLFKPTETDQEATGKTYPCSIGLWHKQYLSQNSLGSNPGSLSYVNNGCIFGGKTSPIKTNAPSFEDGDIIGCGVESCDKHDRLEFDENGALKQPQDIHVYFTKNGKKVFSVHMDYLSDGIFPSVMISKYHRVRILNFYSESKKTFQIQNYVTKHQNQRKTEAKEDSSCWNGCEFIIVGVGNKDAENKIHMLQQKIDLKSDMPALEDLNKHVARLEKHVKKLDLQGQENFTQLCHILDQIKCLSENQQRLHFVSMDMAAPQILADLEKLIADIQERHYKHNLVLNELSKTVLVNTKQVLGKLQSCKILEATTTSFGFKDSITNNVLQSVLQYLQENGLLVMVDIASQSYAVDIQFITEVLPDILKLQSTPMEARLSPAIGKSSRIWKPKNIEEYLTSACKTQKDILLQLLREQFGLIKLLCSRTELEDEIYIYTTTKMISPPPVSLDDFWTGGKANREDAVLMRCSYRFPHVVSDVVFSSIISNVTKYGRVLILTNVGVITQMGAVQTAIIQNKTNKGKTVICVESTCYMPGKKDGPVNELTELTVKDYTWHVLCLYTDIIDSVFKSKRLLPIIKKDVPDEMINMSLGCTHDWSDEHEHPHLQSVCTLCNLCCEDGENCECNGIIGEYLRKCACNTCTEGCKFCGICQRCLKSFWNIKSSLRPMPVTFISSKNVLLTSFKQVSYNEVEYVHLNGGSSSLFLKDINSDTAVQVFPGEATLVDKKGTELRHYCQDSRKHKAAVPGVTVKLRLTDPVVVTQHTEAKDHIPKVQESRVIYHSSTCRELRICQETGILCYDISSSGYPVGQFIGPKPFSTTFRKFSIKILGLGSREEIGVGITPKTYQPNSMPGWRRSSFGFHADDGRIYQSEGTSNLGTGVFGKIGDVMECEVEIKDKTATLCFRHNGKEVHRQILPATPPGGYYPCVSIRSYGGVIKLQEKEPWIPETTNETYNKPTAFDTARYGNLYISPAQTLCLKPYQKENSLYGWLLLHNPSNDKIGYQIVGLDIEEDEKETTVCLHPGQTLPMYLKTKMKVEETCPTEIKVKWIEMEKAKMYTKEYVDKQFKNKDMENRIYEHKLQVVIQEMSDDTKIIQKVIDGVPAVKEMYCLQVFINGTLDNSYWLKSGSYRFDIPYPEGEFIVKYPKAPSYHFPEKVDRGMTVVFLEPREKFYTLAVVNEVKGDGAYTVSYLDAEAKAIHLSLSGQDECSFGMEKEDWEKDVTRFRGHTTTLKTLQRTYVPVPDYLLKEGSRLALNAVNPDWKISSLDLFSNCSQVYTRVTVQEQDIVKMSRQLSQWTSKIAKDRNFAFLPRQMNFTNLEYPHPVLSFSDIAVHNVCYMTRQNLKYKPPVHFVDVPGIPPKFELPLATTFGSKHTAWVYISMLRCKLKIPSYDNLIDIKDEKFSRKKIESVLIKLVQMYASLCSILAAQFGGLSQQQELGKEGHKIIIDSFSKPDNIIDIQGKLPKGAATGDELYSSKMGVTVCMDHLISFADNTDDDYLQTFELGKYSEIIHVFCWENMRLGMLPADLFQKLKSVQIFYMEKCNIFQTSLPKGASTCKELNFLCLDHLSITELPRDLLDISFLQTVALKKLPVKQLDLQWPISHRLTSLELSNLLIESVPKDICKMKSLQRLVLSHNPITDLPMELESLTNLQVLELDGIPWVSLAGKTKSLTIEEFEDWYENKTNIINEKRAKTLFKEFNNDKNSILNEKEIAALNLHLLFEIPRLGTKQFKYLDLFPSAFKKLIGEKKVTVDEYGGIPPVIFKMQKLVILSLKYQGISKVHADIGKLQNLRELKLDNCPLLESVSGSAGVLPNIKDISLVGCPSLSTPPEEVVRNGFKSVKAFLKELAGGQVLCPRTKLMFVGLGAAGKTSLLKALMSTDKKRDPNKQPLLTDGIEISDWKVTTKEENKDDRKTVTFHTWDFAGQTVYYHTHQFFLTNRAVYLLLWNMRMGFEHAGLDFWLNSIMCHAPDAPILIVGTHLDQVAIPELPERHLRSQYKQIHGFYYVSAIDGTNIEELERDLVSAAFEQPYMKQAIPKVWIDLEERIKIERSKCDYLEWTTVTKFAEENGIYDEKIKLALRFLGDLGTIQYFDSEVLNKRIVIKPQWIVDVMAKLVSVKNTLIVQNKGRFNHKDLSKVWEGFDEEVCTWLLSMTEEFDLTFRAPTLDGKSQACNIVPCLVPDDDESPEQILESVSKTRGIREIQILYRFKYLPTGLFNRAQVRLFQFARDTRIWKRGSLLHKGNHSVLIQQTRGTSDVSIIVQGSRPENTLLNVHEVFESLIDETYHGVTYDLFIPCPECESEENIRSCCLFDDSLIRNAKSKKNVYFLQCRGDFHEIPLGYLHGALPEATSSDFYIRLQQSINSLQEINSNIAKDVAVLYSQENIPTEDQTNKIDPNWIRNDLMKHEISCWYEDMELGGIPYMRAVIKSCKVVVLCLSDEFAKDKICREAFDYATDLKVPICAAVITESSEWEKSNIKFRLGTPQMAMLRNKKKYTTKISDLIEMVQGKLQEREEAGNNNKKCFISYSWKNSKEAAGKGTKTNESSLGQDPRELKNYLEDNGVSCWLDDSDAGQEDQIYKDIASGILNCRVAVLCVSQEYVKSENCMMEARFVMQLKKPFVVAIVGNGSKWIESETGLLLQKVARFETVDFQKDKPGALQQLLSMVKQSITESEKKSKLKRKESVVPMDSNKENTVDEHEHDQSDQSIINEHESINFKEEVELIQRKFMRHFAQTAKAKYQNTPRLLVFDFYQSESKSNSDKEEKEGSTTLIGESKVLKEMDTVDGPEENTRASKKRKFGRHESKMDILRQLDITEDDCDWRKEQFCLRILCEHEEGWHLAKDSLSLKTRTIDEIEKYLENTSTYLMYLYIILKFSSVPLLCFNGKKGENFQSWIMEQAKKKSKLGDNFLEAFDSLETFINEHEDEESFIGQLQKCHLPTGRNLWLCGSGDYSHQNGERITKLGIGTRGKGITTLYREDILFNEYLQRTIGPGTLEFASRHYSVFWKHGWAKIKILRLNGTGGVIKSSFRVMLHRRNKVPTMKKDVMVEFKHGATEKTFDVFIKFPELTQDSSVSVKLLDTGNARLGETRKTVVNIKYDGACGCFELPCNTYVLPLSSGYKLDIPVIRNHGTDSIVKIYWKTKNVSASSGDYEPTEGVLQFLERVKEQVISIEVKNDHTIAYKESVVFELQILQHRTVYAEIGDSNSAVVTIYNDSEKHNRKKQSKTISESKVIADESKNRESEPKRKNRPTFKSVATTAMIANAAAAATKNKSTACCLQ